MATEEFEVGRLLCGHFRDALRQMQFRGASLTFYEGSGWLSRTFIVKGPANEIAALDSWARQFNNDTGKG